MKKIITLLLSTFLFFAASAQNDQWHQFGMGRVFNVLYFGAKADGVVVYDAHIVSGQSIVTSSTAAFTSTAVDAGKIIHITGAGAAGARLTDTILTVTNSTTCVIKHTAGTTVTNQMMDYGTDDQVAIQSTIQAAFNAGGGEVWFPVPIKQFYDIAGPFITSVNGVNPICQIYIPLDTGRASNAGRTIELHGEIPPYFPEAGQGSPPIPAPPPFRGVVLYSTITQGSGGQYVIGSSFYNDGFANSNFCTGGFINLCVRSYTGWSGEPHNNSRGGIDCEYLSKCYGDNLMIDNSCPPESTTSAGAGYIGIKGPLIYNFAEITFGRVFVVGYDIGVVLGEHQHYEYLTINTSHYGVQVLTGAAMVSITFYQCEASAYAVYMPAGSGGNYLFIMNYAAEHDNTPSWANFVADVFVDPSLNKQVTILATQMGGAGNTFVTNNPTMCKVKYINQGSTQTIDIDNWTQTLTDSVSGTMTIDLFAGKKASWVFGSGNRTISAFKNMGAGDELVLFVKQDASGSRTLTFPSPSKQSGSLATGANALSRIVVDYDGTTYFLTITNPT